MSDADDLQVSSINPYPDLFSIFADGRLGERLAALEVSPNQAVVSAFDPGVESS